MANRLRERDAADETKDLKGSTSEDRPAPFVKSCWQMNIKETPSPAYITTVDSFISFGRKWSICARFSGPSQTVVMAETYMHRDFSQRIQTSPAELVRQTHAALLAPLGSGVTIPKMKPCMH